ncbi:tRNA pseudouridine55 synthase [Haloactinopolyspora alba]|uniref:tRNA pseudouridine synthase B n=1 Tax=Haloactinopolyspora alba TaxID=648780 RepID=A0A2P8DV70_9ACTN|nr:tRNA pseudouridine(55) synthase TruB [Haloactinopolyspora alba]PSL01133.1 tRNA pseudouridine55 synthase [Haloactinopolyspora alba]
MPDWHGLVVVDKPSGWTSHDVVGRLRRLAGTRRVGHAGTLDPMATGVLVVGVGKATRLLGHLSGTEKSYDATIRLGARTLTDDAEGEVTGGADASAVDEAAVSAGAAALTGDIEQVPSAVSAVKIDGVRSYRRVRSGEDVQLPARPVTVHRFDVTGLHRDGGYLDVQAQVVCTSGTYVRALARDLGESLGVGGHLTALRRTAVGPYRIEAARSLDELAERFDMMSMADAAAESFPRVDVDEETARRVSHGVPLPATGKGPGPVAVFGPDGTLLSLAEDRGPRAKHVAVFVG